LLTKGGWGDEPVSLDEQEVAFRVRMKRSAQPLPSGARTKQASLMTGTIGDITQRRLDAASALP
jgi:hypothetical protein